MYVTNNVIAKNVKTLIRVRRQSELFYKLRDEFIENTLALTDRAKENYKFLLKVADQYTDPYNFQLQDPESVDVDIVNVYIDLMDDMRDVAPHNLQKVYNFLDQY